MDKPELSPYGKLVMHYFVRTSGETPPDKENIETMLTLVQMAGHSAGYDKGLSDADKHRAEDDARADL